MLFIHVIKVSLGTETAKEIHDELIRELLQYECIVDTRDVDGTRLICSDNVETVILNILTRVANRYRMIVKWVMGNVAEIIDRDGMPHVTLITWTRTLGTGRNQSSH